MRIVALTFGTEGDTRPLVALCHGLRDAGHDVVLLAERSGAAYAAECDVPFVALDGDMAAALQLAAVGFPKGRASVRQTAQALADVARGHTAAWMRATLDHAADADAIVVAGLAAFVGFSCAEHLRIPAIGATLQPMMPTRAFPSPFMPPWRLPGWMNAASHRLFLSLMWRAFHRALDEARRTVVGRGPWRPSYDGYPSVCGVSPVLVPPPRDWPERFSITGHWWRPHAAQWHAPAALAAFLAQGESPIYVGFGSMLGFDRERLQALVLGALDGRRALLSAGWGGLGRGALPPTALAIGATPHDWLFPRTRIVVHHGGAGTTHAAARAGRPSVVVPFGGDQPFWADRLRRIGVAPPAIPFAHLTMGALRERLDAALGEPMGTRASAIGDAMADEHGVAHAVACIGRWVTDARGRSAKPSPGVR